jgi:hypothetical protein
VSTEFHWFTVRADLSALFQASSARKHCAIFANSRSAVIRGVGTGFFIEMNSPWGRVLWWNSGWPSVGGGQTTLFIAWMRQMESERPDALFRDPLAGAMLSARTA